MTSPGDWKIVVGRRGKVRGMPGLGAAGQGGGGGPGPSKGGGGSRIFSGGAHTKLKPLENRANLTERPNTVVIDGKGFSVLPSVSELAHFMYETVLTTDTSKELVTQIKSVYVDENKRQYLIQMETSGSTTALVDMLTDEIAWPGYTSDDGGEVFVRGYSMENPVLEIIISGVGWWTPEDTVRKAVSTWGEVKEMKEGKLNVPGLPSFSHVKTDKWFVKLVKKKGVEIPGVVLHLGSERSGEEREMWKIWYRGVPKVCYKCFKDGHVMRECGEKQVLAETMGCQPGIGEEVVTDMGEREVGKKRTFAQVLKEQSYKALQEQDQRRKDKAAMVAQERRERATVKERTSISATMSQTVMESQDELENQHEEIRKIQFVHRNRSAQGCGMDTQRREGKGNSSDDDRVIGVASGSDEDNASVVATLDAEILAADEELKYLLKNLVKEPSNGFVPIYTKSVIHKTIFN